MLLGKKASVMVDTAHKYQAQLEVLYARKSAIDELIDSLEAYERHRATKATPDGQQRKSA